MFRAAKINETDTFGPGDDDEIQFDDIGDDDEDIDDVSFVLFSSPSSESFCFKGKFPSTSKQTAEMMTPVFLCRSKELRLKGEGRILLQMLPFGMF